MVPVVSDPTCTHHGPVAPAGGSILARPGHIGHSLLIGQRLPDLGDLFDPVSPDGKFGPQRDVVHVGVQDHGDGGLVTW